MLYIRVFKFKRPKNVGEVNLLDYQEEIEEAVNDTLPATIGAHVGVENYQFSIISCVAITTAQAQQIGKKIAKIRNIGRLCTQYGNSKQIFISKSEIVKKIVSLKTY
jgi:hypothetical protein